MTADWLYVNVGAERIQHYISRTPRLKGQRGASSWLSWATDQDQLTWQAEAISATPGMPPIEPNLEAGQADGQISVRLPASADPRPVAGALTAYLRSVLPGIELTAIWGAGPTYLEAYRDHLKAQREDPPLRSLPPPADFPPLESCAECRSGPAVTRIGIHEQTDLGVCLDCVARYQDRYRRPGLAAHARGEAPRRLPIYRVEADLARALDTRPVEDTAQDFSVLAKLCGADTQRNHVATVYADGNGIGAFFDRVAGHGDPHLKQRISAAVSQATRDALREATRAVLGPPGPGRRLPVIPHVVGGDDLIVSVVADRAWPFTIAYLEEFGQGLAAIADVPDELLAPAPTASAGVVFAHAKFPFRRAAELAAGRLRDAKRQFCGATPAVAWLDATRDGEQPPAGRRAWSLAELIDRAGALRALRAEVDPSGRAVLERLVDPTRPEISAARLKEHARRMDRAAVLDPFLPQGDPMAAARMAEALSAVRWWR